MQLSLTRVQDGLDGIGYSRCRDRLQNGRQSLVHAADGRLGAPPCEVSTTYTRDTPGFLRLTDARGEVQRLLQQLARPVDIAELGVSCREVCDASRSRAREARCGHRGSDHPDGLPNVSEKGEAVATKRGQDPG